jgi:hypothetical protein
LTVKFDREEGGRWMAEILELPGMLVYGASRLGAKSKVELLALRLLEDRANLEQS